MPRIPLLGPALVALGSLGCGAGDDPPADPTEPPPLPIVDRDFTDEAFALVDSGGDTLRFEVETADGEVRFARYRDTPRGRDSLVAIVTDDGLEPIRSVHRVHREDGPLEATVRYGRGFDGQARLTITSAEGERQANIRTPAPTLDAGQLPLTIGALDLGAAANVSFNFVAPFEERAIPARLEIAPPRELRTSRGAVSAHAVTLRVSGLEERYWFSVDRPHRLLRIEETTRGPTWSRP